MHVQTRILDIQLPSILINFQAKINDFIIPLLNQLIHQLESENNVLLNLVSLLLLIVITKTLFSNLFTFQAPSIKECSQPEIDAELKLLGTQITNLKNSIKKVFDKVKANDSVSHQQMLGQDDVSRLMSCYKKTINDFNQLANFIVDSQDTIFNQVRTLKKSSSRSSKLFQSSYKDTQASKDHETNESETYELSQQPKVDQVKAIPKRPLAPPKKKIAPPPPSFR